MGTYMAGDDRFSLVSKPLTITLRYDGSSFTKSASEHIEAHEKLGCRFAAIGTWQNGTLRDLAV